MRFRFLSLTTTILFGCSSTDGKGSDASASDTSFTEASADTGQDAPDAGCRPAPASCATAGGFDPGLCCSGKCDLGSGDCQP